jgi:tetratricopeptide (TPR) repeat protein
MDVFYGGSKSPEQSFRNAFESIQKSLSIGPTCAFPHTVLSFCYLFGARQHDKAIAACQQAVTFDPNDAWSYSVLALVLTYSGKADEAMGAIEKGFRLNPRPPNYYFSYQGLIYYHKGMYEEALSALKKALNPEPNSIPIRFRLAACYSSLGREDEARAEVAALLKLNPNLSLGYLQKMFPYKNQADLDLMINALRKAGLK